MRRRIFLHGIFKAFHDGPIEVFAETIAEAIERVTTQLPGFQPNAVTGRKEIQVPGCSSMKDLHRQNNDEDIHIFPALVFGKNGGVLKTIIGVALIVVGIGLQFVPGAHAIGWNFIFAGATMLIGGLAQLLSPQPNSQATHRSQYLSDNQNTVAIGTPIPILYGRRRCYGQILSLEVSSQDTTG